MTQKVSVGTCLSNLAALYISLIHALYISFYEDLQYLALFQFQFFWGRVMFRHRNSSVGWKTKFPNPQKTRTWFLFSLEEARWHQPYVQGRNCALAKSTLTFEKSFSFLLHQQKSSYISLPFEICVQKSKVVCFGGWGYFSDSWIYSRVVRLGSELLALPTLSFSLPLNKLGSYFYVGYIQSTVWFCLY